MKIDKLSTWNNFGKVTLLRFQIFAYSIFYTCQEHPRQSRLIINKMSYYEWPTRRMVATYNRLQRKNRLASFVGFLYWGYQRRKRPNPRDSYRTFLLLRCRQNTEKVLELGVLRSCHVNKYLKVLCLYHILYNT